MNKSLKQGILIYYWFLLIGSVGFESFNIGDDLSNTSKRRKEIHSMYERAVGIQEQLGMRQEGRAELITNTNQQMFRNLKGSCRGGNPLETVVNLITFPLPILVSYSSSIQGQYSQDQDSIFIKSSIPDEETFAVLAHESGHRYICQKAGGVYKTNYEEGLAEYIAEETLRQLGKQDNNSSKFHKEQSQKVREIFSRKGYKTVDNYIQGEKLDQREIIRRNSVVRRRR